MKKFWKILCIEKLFKLKGIYNFQDTTIVENFENRAN